LNLSIQFTTFSGKKKQQKQQSPEVSKLSNLHEEAGSPGPSRKGMAIRFQAGTDFSLQDLPHLVSAEKLIPALTSLLAFMVPAGKKILSYNYSIQY